MCDIAETSIRSLEQIVVNVGDGSVNLNMVLDKRHSLESNMTRVEGEFLRKVGQLSSSKYFSVVGDPRYNDESAETVFVAIIMNLYLEDGKWQFPTIQAMGVLGLEEPTGPDVNNCGGRSALSQQGSTCTAKRRKATDVCSELLHCREWFRGYYKWSDNTNSANQRQTAPARWTVATASTLQDEVILFRRITRCTPYVTPAVYAYLTRALPTPTLFRKAAFAPGAMMTIAIKDELKKQGVDAWRMEDGKVSWT